MGGSRGAFDSSQIDMFCSCLSLLRIVIGVVQGERLRTANDTLKSGR